MNDNFLIITQLQYEIRALRAELEAFRSGEKYRKMLEVRAQDLRDYNRQIHALKVEAEEADVAEEEQASEETERCYRDYYP